MTESIPHPPPHVVGKTALEEGMKTCRACATPMPAVANKCSACSSLQDWQRYLNLSGSVLGLLVALVSVLTFALPIWRRQFTIPEPRPFIAFTQADPRSNRFFLTASNGGDAPMTIFALSLRFSYEGRKEISIPLSIPDSGRVVNLNEVKEIIAQPDPIQNSIGRPTPLIFAAAINKLVSCSVNITAFGPTGHVYRYFQHLGKNDCSYIILSLDSIKLHDDALRALR